MIKSIMVKDFDAFVDRNSSRMTQGFSSTKSRSDKIWMKQMSSAAGEEWKDLRSTFSPIFTSGKMKAMLKFIQQTSNVMMEHIDKEVNNNRDFEVKEIMGKFSMDTIASCAFGVDAQAFTNKDSKFVEYASGIFKQTITDGLKVFMILLNFMASFVEMISLAFLVSHGLGTWRSTPDATVGHNIDKIHGNRIFLPSSHVLLEA